MNMDFVRKLPVPKELKEQFSLPEKLVSVKAARDDEIQKVFTGKSNKKLLIIGCCSGLHCPSCQSAGESQGQADYHSPDLHQQTPYHRRGL